ncbi:MAG TPA: SGNH/GDSL hydrolase family protein [Gallionella sp.]|nr:SGNH/GDSL hydrolase family protein [Gallionella sp.]
MSMLLAGLTILVLGESHMALNGQLISTLPNDLVDQGAKVFSYGACGASAGDWLVKKSVNCSAFRVDTGPVRVRPADIASTYPIGDLLAQHRPDLVVVIIGDTMASYDKKEIVKNWVWQGVSSLTKEIRAHGTRCVWVGPAWGQEGGKYKKINSRAKEFSDYLSTLVAPCTYIDSLTFSKIGEWKTIDGEHFDSAGYKGWAKGITDAITSLETQPTLKAQAE